MPPLAAYLAMIVLCRCAISKALVNFDANNFFFSPFEVQHADYCEFYSPLFFEDGASFPSSFLYGNEKFLGGAAKSNHSHTQRKNVCWYFA